MATQWVSGPALLPLVTGSLGMDDTAEMAARWGPICDWAARRAQQDVTEILAFKGYGPDQIAAFDYRADYASDLAIFLAVQRGQPDKLADYQSMDRREQLRDSLLIIAGGVPVGPTAPPGTGVGGVGYGDNAARAAPLEDAYTRGLFRRP